MPPTIEDNVSCFGKEYSWPDEGNEWSVPWGGTPYLWYGTIFPRIFPFLPATNILEIAPGFGRCTQYLLGLCTRLQIIDLNANCIDHCRNRFRDFTNIEYYVNDGKHLDGISDNSVDFVFSWDSLVHCESDVLESYVNECSRILKPDGIGFFHHSNLGEYYDASRKCLSCENLHGRAESVSASSFKKFCDDHGLVCVNQEIINWRGDIRNDCLSLFIKTGENNRYKHNLFVNNEFHREILHVRDIANMYDFRRSHYEQVIM